jgi:hypothetical protein
MRSITDRFHPYSAINRTPSAAASSCVRNSRCQVTEPFARPNALRYLVLIAFVPLYLGRDPVRARTSSPSPATQSRVPSANPPSRHRCR